MSGWGNGGAQMAPVCVFRLRQRAPPGWRAYQTIWFVFIVGVLVQNAWRHDRVATALWAAAVLLAPLSWRAGRLPRLVISSNGIIYETSLFTLRTGWGELERIGRYWESEGIVLARAEWERPRWLRWLRRPPRAFIPLRNGMGGPYWEPGVGDALQEFAPWLTGDAGRGQDEGSEAVTAR